MEIDKLISQFSTGTLPKDEWTHEAHIIVAIWHNLEFGFEAALEEVRSKIISYNEVVGTPNTDVSGYHETLTVFWMTLTKNFLIKHRGVGIEEACRLFLSSEQAVKVKPFQYYTQELLFSKRARKSWVNGDIQKLELAAE